MEMGEVWRGEVGLVGGASLCYKRMWEVKRCCHGDNGKEEGVASCWERGQQQWGRAKGWGGKVGEGDTQSGTRPVGGACLCRHSDGSEGGGQRPVWRRRGVPRSRLQHMTTHT